MINRFPKLFLLLTSVLFIGTVATLKSIGALIADRVSQNLWILLGCELGALLCICLCALWEAHLLRRKVLVQNEQLKRQTLHDYLTQCYNRRALMNALHDWKRSNVNEEAGILMIDVDDFKQINDNFGHAVGDAVLQDLADILRKLLGNNGFVARYGGDEFCVFVQHASIDNILALGEQMRHVVETHSFTSSVNVTLSSGAVIVNRSLSVDKALCLADAAMYEAKKRGKNQLVVF